MTKKSTILLVVGVTLFVASPFLFYFVPGWITPLFHPSSDYFSYLGIASVIGVITMAVAVIAGVTLILLTLRPKKRK